MVKPPTEATNPSGSCQNRFSNMVGSNNLRKDGAEAIKKAAKALQLNPNVYQEISPLMYRSGIFQICWRITQKSAMSIPVIGEIKTPKEEGTVMNVFAFARNLKVWIPMPHTARRSTPRRCHMYLGARR